MIKGKVTISRRSTCKGDGSVVITIEDRASGITIIEAQMEFSEFAECITGMSYCDADLTVASAEGHSYIGMKRVTETLDIPVSSHLNKSEESRKLIENSVPDGWILWSDGLNSQQRKKGVHQFVVCKYVEENKQ